MYEFERSEGTVAFTAHQCRGRKRIGPAAPRPVSLQGCAAADCLARWQPPIAHAKPACLPECSHCTDTHNTDTHTHPVAAPSWC
jgi:hypothetical protein